MTLILTPLSQFTIVLSQPPLAVPFSAIAVCFLFGPSEVLSMSTSYMVLEAQYPVWCGDEFWLHLTGDKNFYIRMLQAMGEVLDEGDFEGSEILQAKVKEFAEEIKQICGREI